MVTPSTLFDFKSNNSIATAFKDFRANSSLNKFSFHPEGTVLTFKDQQKSSRQFELFLEMTELSKNNKNLKEKVISAMESIKKLKLISKELKKKDFEIDILQKKLEKSEELLIKKRKKFYSLKDTLNGLCDFCDKSDDEGIARFFEVNQRRNLKNKLRRKSLSVEETEMKTPSKKILTKNIKSGNLKSPYDYGAKVFSICSKKVKGAEMRVQSFTPFVKSGVEEGKSMGIVGIKLEMLLIKTRNILELMKINYYNNA